MQNAKAIKMFGRPLFMAIFWLAVLALDAGASSAQTDTTSPNAAAAVWAWTTEAWDASGRPFQQVRDSIWQDIEKGRKPESLTAKYKLLAKAEAYHPPYNAAAQFRWAYAAYQAAVAKPQFRNRADFGQAAQALGYGPSPRSYEYARLRFLMEAMNWPDRHLKVVGERLLRRRPDDFQVKYRLAHVLASGSTSPQDMTTAISYAQQLVQAMPNKANLYGLLGETYYTRWLAKKSKADADSAIAAYEKYLALAPHDDGFRQQAYYLVQKMREG